MQMQLKASTSNNSKESYDLHTSPSFVVMENNVDTQKKHNGVILEVISFLHPFIFQTNLEHGSQTLKDQMEDVVVCFLLPGAEQTDWI